MTNLIPTPSPQPPSLNNGEPKNPSKIQLLRLADSQGKIGESSEEQVKSVLKYVFVLLGLNQADVPDDYEKAVLLSFIYTHYGNRYSCQDIKNAFEFGIAGVFPVDKEIYGKRFSPLYLSRFMDSYGAYKFAMAKHYQEVRPKEKPLELQRSVQEREEAIHKVIEDYITKNNEIPLIIDVVSCFNTLVRQGKISPTPELDEANKQAVIKKNNAEIGSKYLMLTESEVLSNRKAFETPNNLKLEVMRKYLLDYWAVLFGADLAK